MNIHRLYHDRPRLGGVRAFALGLLILLFDLPSFVMRADTTSFPAIGTNLTFSPGTTRTRVDSNTVITTGGATNLYNSMTNAGIVFGNSTNGLASLFYVDNATNRFWSSATNMVLQISNSIFTIAASSNWVAGNFAASNWVNDSFLSTATFTNWIATNQLASLAQVGSLLSGCARLVNSNTFTGSNRFTGVSVFEGPALIPYVSRYKITNIVDSGLTLTQRGEAILFADDSTPAEVINSDAGATVMTNVISAFKVPLNSTNIFARCNNIGDVKEFYIYNTLNTTTEITLAAPAGSGWYTGDGFLYTATVDPIYTTNIVDALATNFGTILTAASNSFLPTITWTNWLATNGLASISYVDGATNQIIITARSYTDIATQGLAGVSVTNGLASIFYVDNATNSALTAGKNYTDGRYNSVTNGASLTNVPLTALQSMPATNALIAYRYITNTADSVTLTLPQTNRHLLIVCKASQGITSGGNDPLVISFNGDTSANYTHSAVYYNGSVASADTQHSTNGVYCGCIAGYRSQPLFSDGECRIHYYTQAVVHTTISSFGGVHYDAKVFNFHDIGVWTNAAFQAISNVTIRARYASPMTNGSEFFIYALP